MVVGAPAGVDAWYDENYNGVYIYGNFSVSSRGLHVVVPYNVPVDTDGYAATLELAMFDLDHPAGVSARALTASGPLVFATPGADGERATKVIAAIRLGGLLSDEYYLESIPVVVTDVAARTKTTVFASPVPVTLQLDPEKAGAGAVAVVTAESLSAAGGSDPDWMCAVWADVTLSTMMTGGESAWTLSVD